MVRATLVDGVERAQDALWEYRGQIVRDPEAAIAGLDFIGDARTGTDGGAHQYALLDVDSAAGNTTLTLVVHGGAATGGGWSYEQSEAVTCVDFVFPEAADEIRVEPAECADLPEASRHDDIVPFGDLQVREVVTAADYPPPICQCHSGSDCDCPGG